LEALKKKHLQGFFAYLSSRPHQQMGGSLSAAYIAKYWQALRNLDRYLRETRQWGLSLPPADMRIERNVRAVLTKAEVMALYSACDPTPLGMRDRAMLALYYGCGLRRGEGVGLDVNDLLFSQGLVYVRYGKGNRERYVPMNHRVVDDLRQYLQHSRPLLLGSQTSPALLVSSLGRRADPLTLAHRLQYLQAQSGHLSLQQKSISLHCLRHSVATHLLLNGMELERIAHFLGHTSLESTQIYTHLAHEVL
jgi:site-specific recombinase XerD